MQRFNARMMGGRALLIGGAALILAASGAAIATAQNTGSDTSAQAEVIRADHKGGKGERGHHKRHGHRGGGGEMFRTIFDAVDANGDQIVTMEEIDTYRAGRVADVDASGDGALSIEEFDTLYRQLTRARMVDAFQDLDADGDGVISAEELDTRITRMFERMDRDGDGVLTLQRPGQGKSDG